MTNTRSGAWQAGVQLAAGVLPLSIFFWVAKLRWKGNCLMATLYVVTSLLVAQDNHMGSKLVAAALLLGCTWVASLMAGAVVSVAVSMRKP